ncbi:MAG: peptidoglycan DD-metalloendopeptidase family protein [Gammaproteobacteria bacterium]|nr:MAG: peptidoglycan DD-metalloendopeptidase family protein [Gammaproteobacteria bacterium]
MNGYRHKVSIKKHRLFACALLVTGFACLPLAFADKQEATRKRELTQLRYKIESLQQELNQTRGNRDEQRVKLRQLDEKVDKQLRKLRQTQGDINKTRKQLQRLQRQQQLRRNELDKHTAYLERQIQAAYAMGRQEYLKLLLNQRDPAELSRLLVYYQYMNRARGKSIEQAKSTLNRLKTLQREIKQRENRLQNLKTGQSEQQKRLQAQQAERRIVLATLNQRVQNQSQQLEALREDQRRLEILLQRLQGYLADIPQAETFSDRFSKHRGRLRLPVKGSIGANYGSPRGLGKLRWKGLFINAPEGRDVRGVFRGRVAYANWLRGFGLLLIVDHGNGYMSLYGHNRSLYKEVGDWIETGQVIASSGNTGNPPRPGLYFEIRKDGRPRDPLVWCKRR